MSEFSLVAGVVAGITLIAGLIIVLLSKRTHIRSWRVGLFYESEERFGNEDAKQDGQDDSETA